MGSITFIITVILAMFAHQSETVERSIESICNVRFIKQ